jgi:hypothetical protein
MVYFPEIEKYVAKPYSSSTKWLIIGLIFVIVLIGIFYFLIAAGYIASVSPTDPANPKNVQNYNANNTASNTNSKNSTFSGNVPSANYSGGGNTIANGSGGGNFNPSGGNAN